MELQWPGSKKVITGVNGKSLQRQATVLGRAGLAHVVWLVDEPIAGSMQSNGRCQPTSLYG